MGATATTPADALRAAVLAARDDEGTLRVWADSLLERGDPRGELIQLQLAPPSPARDKAVASFVRKHGRALLGPLAAVVMVNNHVVFDRGLLAECAIATDARAKVAAVVGHPDWTTVRSIYFRNYSGGAIEPVGAKQPHPAVALLLDATLARLPVALGLGLVDVLAPLCVSGRQLALERVFLMDYDHTGETPAATRRQIVDSQALPSLRHLGMERVPPAWLLEAAWVSQLDTIELCIPGTMLLEALALVERSAPRVKTLIVRPDCVFTNGYDRPEWLYTFAKDGERFATVEVTTQSRYGGRATPEPRRKKAFLRHVPKSLKISHRPEA
jgi:uncharacterized protein (TIGR02996 family)